MTEILDDDFARAHPVTFVPSYESLAVTPVVGSAGARAVPMTGGDPLTRRLVLFDIDGTLLSAGGISARALADALEPDVRHARDRWRRTTIPARPIRSSSGS